MALIKINNRSSKDNAIHGRRNLIINGAMEVAQRATTFATAVSNGYHVVDRIRVMGSSNVGQWTISQDSDVPAGFVKSLKYECTTADTSLASTDHLGLGYFPEGYHMNPVGKGTSGAKSMTLSFYLKANVTKTLVVEVTDAGLARHVNFTVTPSATNTWERITLSIPADTSGSFNQGTNSKGAEINFWLASGTTYTGGSNQSTWTSRTNANIVAGGSNWADTVGNTIWITGLQLEVGDTATPFEHRSYEEELALCERYYQIGHVYRGINNDQEISWDWQHRQTLRNVSASRTYTKILGSVTDSITYAANVSSAQNSGFYRTESNVWGYLKVTADAEI